nr:hypothetical protein BN993_01906 [Virgibacillus halodenitrificans]
MSATSLLAIIVGIFATWIIPIVLLVLVVYLFKKVNKLEKKLQKLDSRKHEDNL